MNLDIETAPAGNQRQSVDIIVPVRNAAGLIADCVESVIPQLTASSRIIVVDDASIDRTGDIASNHGAKVHRLPEPVGPYRARQIAAFASEADILIFLDVRCRVRPGWMEEHLRALWEPATVLAASSVSVLPRPTRASNALCKLQPFSSKNYMVSYPTRYFPTCNLSVKRQHFNAVEGFANLRSGADADFCWRVIDTVGGRICLSEKVMVDWEPRSTLPAVFEQYRKYGRGAESLYVRHPTRRDNMIHHSPISGLIRMLRQAAGFVRGRESFQTSLDTFFIQFAFELGLQESRIRRILARNMDELWQQHSVKGEAAGNERHMRSRKDA